MRLFIFTDLHVRYMFYETVSHKEWWIDVRADPAVHTTMAKQHLTFVSSVVQSIMEHEFNVVLQASGEKECEMVGVGWNRSNGERCEGRKERISFVWSAVERRQVQELRVILHFTVCS